AAPAPAAAPAAAGAGTVLAPLPGVVLSIPVKVGDSVGASDPVVILEAMKMENAIPAGRAGKVIAINVKEGDSVLEGAVLVTLG
ncbi:MAG: acetyl-CoA carboxylase biotin carboxyl carrier protein subunit, partial [Muribaculaceae bacterium]|nr:acetyl-CoA carboxylase biotin carboxyl carrier protein subunit [Muribaculaceae bacterium]